MSDGLKLQCITTATFSRLLSCFVVLHFCSEHWQLNHFKSQYDSYNLFTAEKVGGALAPPARWLPRHWTSDTLQTVKVKGSNVKVTAWRNVVAIKCYKSWTDRMTDFKLGENYASAERNVWRIFMIVRSNRPEIEICQVFDMYSERKPGNVVWSTNYCPLLGNWGHWI